MTHPTSGWLRGLIAGFVAMLAGVAGYGAAAGGFYRLPAEVRWFAGDPALSFTIAICLAGGLLIGLVMWLVRPRTYGLAVAAAVFGFGLRALGSVAAEIGNALGMGTPMSAVQEFLPQAPAFVWEVMRTSVTFWLGVAAAAVPAFLLVLLRVARLRRRARLQAQVEEPVVVEEEPEYRAPFEPAQAPTQQTTTDMFTPRKPTQ